jgi:hypothetical protein
LPLFSTNVGAEKDFDLRDRMLSLALRLFNRSTTEQFLALTPQQFSLVLKEVALKNCIWKAGRKAIQLRCIAVQLVYTMMNHYKHHTDMVSVLKPFFESDLLPVVLTNMDDDEIVTRRHCLLILDNLLELQFFQGITC